MWFVHIFVFVLVPLMDYLLNKDKYNIPQDEVSNRAKEWFYRLVTYSWVFVQLGVLFLGFLRSLIQDAQRTGMDSSGQRDRPRDWRHWDHRGTRTRT